MSQLIYALPGTTILRITSVHMYSGYSGYSITLHYLTTMACNSQETAFFMLNCYCSEVDAIGLFNQPVCVYLFIDLFSGHPQVAIMACNSQNYILYD